MTATDYRTHFYTDFGKEFIQHDDYSFELHHCSRFLYLHRKEAIDLLRAGPLGAALKHVGGRLPEMLVKPTVPTLGPRAVQGSWCEDVYERLPRGVLPKRRGVRSEVSKRC
jgi:hypothetical protein